MEDRRELRIGLFGGTFDPPHNGHINLILSLFEAHHLDRVLVVPAQSNPLKPSVASSQDRLAMAHLAFDAVPGCTVLDVEVLRPGPSYAIDTVRWLLDHDTDFAKAERYLLLGADAAASLPQWRQGDQLLTLVHPLIAARSGFEGPQEPMALLDISSTDLRSRIRQRLYVDHLVPERVMAYVRKVQLYT